MRAALRAVADRWLDPWLGRGDAAITVPPMDGPFKPNRLLDEAEVVASFAAPEDLASDGQTVWVADGARLFGVRAADMHGEPVENHLFPGPITALAHVPRAGLVAVVSGSEIFTVGAAGWRTGPRQVAGAPLRGVNALSACADGSLLATEGSARHGADWARDLMTLGHSGRLLRLTPDGGGDAELAAGLRHAFGALELDGRIWASESWAHRVFELDAKQSVADRLPAYPSRLAPAAGGGAWLTLFAARTRLVEFVLREPAYRRRMVDEVDPRHWVAPALSSGHSFLEPLQGGAVKQLGIVKPWAPPRSYGLVVRLNAGGLPTHSLHSRADGVHHGIVSAVEAGGWLYVLAKGAGRLLRLKLDGLSKEER